MPWRSCRSTKPRHSKENCTRVDLAPWVMKVTVQSLGEAMPTLVIQKHHLWLNLVEMRDVDKVRLLDVPVSQAGLFGDAVEDCAQQSSAAQKQTEAIQHILPRCDPPPTTIPSWAVPQSARHRGCPPASSRVSLSQECSASRVPAAPIASSQEIAARGCNASPRISGWFLRGHGESCCGEPGCDAFCAIQHDFPPLHHRRCVNCPFDATA